MKLCVPYKFWEAAMMVAPKDDVRYYLNGVHLAGNRIEATNGHMLYQAKIRLSDGALQTNNGSEPFDPVWPDLIIQSVGAEPTSSVKNKTVWLHISAVEDANNFNLVIYYVDSMFSVLHIQPASIVDGRFPDANRVIPNGKKAPKEAFLIGFNPEYLAMPSKLLRREKEFKGVKMEAYAQNESAKIQLCRPASEAEEELLVIMPIRI